MIIYILLVILVKILFVNFLYKCKKIKLSLGLGFIYVYSNIFFLFSVIPGSIFDRKYLNINLSLILFLSLLSCIGFLYSLVNIKNKVSNKIIRIIFFSFSFLVVEISIYYLLGLILIQDSNSLIFDFSTISAGYALALTPISKIFSYYGYVFILTFVLSFTIALINEYKMRYGIILLYIFCIIFYKENNSIDNIPRVMILPEGIIYEKINTNLDYIKNNYDYLIEGGEILENGKKYNISKYYDFKNNIIIINYKYFLFPLGEYIPLSAFFYKYAMENRTDDIKLKVYDSKNENNLINIYDQKALILLCADAWSYKSVSRFKDIRGNIDYVIVQRSDAIFNSSNLYKAQIELYKQVLSDYFRKPIIDVTTYKYLEK